MRTISARTLAILACGLRADSRIMRNLAGVEHDIDTLLMANMVDSLSWLVWSKTKDAEHNRNKPQSVYKLLTNPDENKAECERFATANDFERAREEILRGNNNGY